MLNTHFSFSLLQFLSFFYTLIAKTSSSLSHTVVVTVSHAIYINRTYLRFAYFSYTQYPVLNIDSSCLNSLSSGDALSSFMFMFFHLSLSHFFYDKKKIQTRFSHAGFHSFCVFNGFYKF